MLYSGKQIASKIRTHIKKRGGAYPSWVAGVSSDVRKHLFKTHNVRKKGDFWIFLHAESARVARRVKSYLVVKLGIAGMRKAVEDDMTADFVYAYRRSGHTRP